MAGMLAAANSQSARLDKSLGAVIRLHPDDALAENQLPTSGGLSLFNPSATDLSTLQLATIVSPNPQEDL